MQLKDMMFRRRLKSADAPESLEKTEERVVILGWLCMTATLLLAVLLAAYAAV
jgi:hypothetical protein